MQELVWLAYAAIVLYYEAIDYKTDHNISNCCLPFFLISCIIYFYYVFYPFLY